MSRTAGVPIKEGPVGRQQRLAARMEQAKDENVGKTSEQNCYERSVQKCSELISE